MSSLILEPCPKGHYRYSVYDCRPCSDHCGQNSDWSKRNCKKACPDVFEEVHSTGATITVPHATDRNQLIPIVLPSIIAVILLCVTVGVIIFKRQKSLKKSNGRLQDHRSSYDALSSNMEMQVISDHGNNDTVDGQEAASLSEVLSEIQPVSDHGDSLRNTTELSEVRFLPNQLSVQVQEAEAVPETNSVVSEYMSEFTVYSGIIDDGDSNEIDNQTPTPAELGIQLQ